MTRRCSPSPCPFSQSALRTHGYDRIRDGEKVYPASSADDLKAAASGFAQRSHDLPGLPTLADGVAADTVTDKLRAARPITMDRAIARRVRLWGSRLVDSDRVAMLTELVSAPFPCKVRFWITLDLYRKRPGGVTSRSRTSRGPGRFG